MSSLTFECPRCEQEDPDTFAHLPGIDDWLRFFPDEGMLHVHFGRSTHTQQESDIEADWLTSSIEAGLSKYTTTTFIALIDVSRADDSEFPSEKSREVYRTLLSHPQMKKAIFFGVTPAMSFLIKTVAHVSGRQRHIFVVPTLQAALEKIEVLQQSQE